MYKSLDELVMNSKASLICGIIAKAGAKSITMDEVKIARAGTPLLEISVTFESSLECPSVPIWYKWRPAEKIAEFKADAADVSTTKLMTPAAPFSPARAKTCTNGLCWGLISRQGLMDMMMIIAPI